MSVYVYVTFPKIIESGTGGEHAVFVVSTNNGYSMSTNLLSVTSVDERDIILGMRYAVPLPRQRFLDDSTGPNLREVVAWCRDALPPDSWGYDLSTDRERAARFYFSRDSDALAFVIRWSG